MSEINTSYTVSYDMAYSSEALTLFGFIVGNYFQLDIARNLLFKLTAKDEPYNTLIKLRPTMMRLLTYLVCNANSKVVSHDDILTEVWEQYGLMATNQRLAQVITQLKSKLRQLGIPSDLIINVHGKGYMLAESSIVRLYRTVGPSTIGGGAIHLNS